MTRSARSVTIYQSLLGSLAVVILLLGGATIALTFVGSKQTAEDLAGVLLEKTVSQVELNLRQFFEPATRALELLRGWEAAGLLDPDEQAASAVSMRASDYDPRQRPWYRGAVSARPQAGERIHWTEPYLFYTAGAPGITAAMAFDGRDRRARVVGVDVLLTDISSFTTDLRAGAHGQVTVLTEEGRVIGLPHEVGDRDAATQLQALLKRPEEIGTPL